LLKGELVFFCGKMGSGKSTLARETAAERKAVLISEDELLSQLFPDIIRSVSDYKRYSDLLKPVVSDLAQQILNKGVSVVLDFPANTPAQRHWLRRLSENTNAQHLCYFVDRTDEVCIQQLLQRGNPNTDSVEMFHAITAYFTPPGDDEGINTVIV